MSSVIELLLSMATNEIGCMAAIGSLRVMERNINGRSCSCGYCMPVKLIANQILEKAPHIFVLTEFVETASWSDLKALLSDSFDVYTRPYRPRQNGVCIGIRKNSGITLLSDGVYDFPTTGPDFHAVKIRVNGMDISVVGTRIQIGPKLTKSEFECRFSQFCALANYLTALLETENVIALGDFNNARILGNEGETNVEEIDKAYQENGVELVQSRYNLQKAREYLLRNTGGRLSFITSKGNCSSVGVQLEGRTAVPPKEDPKQRHKYDQVITNLSTKGVATYDWAFLKNYSQEQFEWDKKQHKMVIKVGYPDHAILWGELELPRQDAASPKGPSPEKQDCAQTHHKYNV